MLNCASLGIEKDRLWEGLGQGGFEMFPVTDPIPQWLGACDGYRPGPALKVLPKARQKWMFAAEQLGHMSKRDQTSGVL
eukprot:1162004-Pelagomonas_calceolata.AAC.1